MTFIHHYNITEYIHCPKYSLCSTYSYPPPAPPHSPITPWQPVILRTFFMRVGILLVIETEVTEIGASITFSVAKFPLTTVSRQLAQDLNPCLSLLQVITVLKSTVWSHFNYFISYLGVVHLIISKANSFLNSSPSYIRTYVRTEKVLSWQGIFFSLDPVLLF